MYPGDNGLALIIFHRLRGSTSSRPGWYRRSWVAERVFLLGEPCGENAEVTVRLEGITVNRIFDLVQSEIAEQVSRGIAALESIFSCTTVLSLMALTLARERMPSNWRLRKLRSKIFNILSP